MADSKQLLRQWKVLRTLSARRLGMTVADLAHEMDVNERTIRRDLLDLKQVGFPVLESVGEHGRKHWKLDDTSGLAELRFTLEEAAALYLGRQFLEPLAGTLFYQGSQSAFKKIQTTLGDAALRHLSKLAQAFHLRTHGFVDYTQKAALVDELLFAVEERRMAAIEYRSLRTTEPVTHYDVCPLGLIWYREALYLIAESKDHNQVRTFKVDRLTGLECLDLQFQRPDGFSLEDFFQHSFGIFEGNGAPEEVRVRFRQPASRFVEERQFHPSQKLQSQRDGTTIATYQLAAFDDLIYWVLGFGPLAEILSPPALRDRIATALQQAAELYAPAPAGAPSPSRLNAPR